MFDWVLDIIDGIRNFFLDILNFLVDLAVSALNTTGIPEMWNAFKQAEVINTLFYYTPVIQKLAHWDIITLVFAAEFSILIALITFKVIVKLIPTIW